jgi:hypothetical protein
MPFKGTVTLTVYDHFGTGAGVVVTSKPVDLPAGPGVRCAGFEQILRSRMPLSFTPLLRLKRCHACDQ